MRPPTNQAVIIKDALLLPARVLPRTKADQPSDVTYSRPQRKGKHKRKKEDNVMLTPESITIGASVQVRELAEAMGKTAAEVVKK